MCLTYHSCKLHFASQVGKCQAAPQGFEPGAFCLGVITPRVKSPSPSKYGPVSRVLADAMEIGNRIFHVSTAGEYVDGVGERQVKIKIKNFLTAF